MNIFNNGFLTTQNSYQYYGYFGYFVGVISKLYNHFVDENNDFFVDENGDNFTD